MLVSAIAPNGSAERRHCTADHGTVREHEHAARAAGANLVEGRCDAPAERGEVLAAGGAMMFRRGAVARECVGFFAFEIGDAAALPVAKVIFDETFVETQRDARAPLRTLARRTHNVAR